MDEFNDCGGLDLLIAGIAKGTRREQDEQGPQTLATAGDDVLGDLGNEDDIALQTIANVVINGLHIGGRQRSHFIKGQGNCCVFGKLHQASDNA